MPVELSVPAAQDEYVRTFDAEIDVLSESELLVRGRMSDHRFEFEHVWKVTTPGYEVTEARASQLRGGEDQFDPDLCYRYSGISGVRIGRGFSKRILNELGDLPGRQEHLFLAIEMARISQQVYQFPPEFDDRFAVSSEGQTDQAYAAWRKDRAYMTDLINSCYTYRDESEALFKSREVRCGFDAQITRPKPGDNRVFWRGKRLSIALDGNGYRCQSAMDDRIHEIRIAFDLNADGVIANASSEGLRLPYHGICEDAQLRTSGLDGMRVSEGFILQFADRIGGAGGCTHLFDLSIDCLRLFKFMQS